MLQNSQPLPFSSGTWTPVVTFATPGDLAVAYTNQVGKYQVVGPLVIAYFDVLTSIFTYTTAAGAFELTGLPFLPAWGYRGTCAWQGITKAGFTEVTPSPSRTSPLIQFYASGSGQVTATLGVADVPSGGIVRLRGSCFFTK